jgi:hypothetical protein
LLELAEELSLNEHLWCEDGDPRPLENHLFIPYLLDSPNLGHLCAYYIPSLLVLYGFVTHHFLPLLFLDIY